ncbi:FHA domain-containing protein [Pseudarthrobacter sp. NamE2]|uniref:FHA domain-containing protein n=1 Tax=Pseudarthrobacter sp. NamE2 TaxID=2576838 RepID=UPI0010FE0F81|nr:FHA domain-containing protein [Pseudarthrobacter sp. NamE2]TLM84843.1 FHA domain-containing protein [Pseudarthrobacter sp. NamE2]
MAGTSYTPGSWLGIVRSGTAVVLGPDTPPALVPALWDLLAGQPQVHEVLHAVTSSSGGSLADIPSFGILDVNGSLRVFLRGDLELTVGLSDGPVELNGRDVTTWNERAFALPDECTLSIPGAGAAVLPELPLAEGVVLLRALTLRPAAGQLAVTAAEPAAAAVVVDAEGNANVQQAVPVQAAAAEREAPAAAEREAPAAPEREAPAAPPVPAEPAALLLPGPDGQTQVPELTIAPEHEVSAETVYGVPDDEAGFVDPAAPAGDLTSSYDHLWERTVMRNIEDAAVREEPEDGHAASAPVRAPALEPVVERPALADPAGAQPATDGSSADSSRENANQADTPVPPVRPAPAGVLIDSVPWRTSGTSGQPTAPVPPNPLPLNPPPANLAPGPSSIAGARQETQAARFDGDHDGQTVMKSSIAGTASRPPAPSAGSGGPQVLARVCGQGHPNPPTRARCASCGGALLPDAVQVARPRLGRMRLSTGELLDLDQTLVIGRQPSVSRVQGGVMPRLVQVASPGGDISRSHVEVRLEGWHVMLCDLKATNGTVLVREGQPPRRLAQNEMAILLDGDMAELGDDISLRFEELP